jgi:hypothetical protein
MVNPDPARITDPMWKLWTDRPNLTWKLGGFYADKKGYHNTVIANQKKWPGTYSIRVPLDLVKINRDKARAMDTTMTDAEMVKWTQRMKASAENPLDTRLAAVREFYGTLDNQTVFGLIKDDENGPWKRSSADSTHLWHGHKSIFTAFVDDWKMLAPILTVEGGQTFEEWSISGMNLPKLGDTGESVKYWQLVHNTCINAVSPPSVHLKVDAEYGPATEAAFTDFWKKSGGADTFKATYLPGWLALKYHIALAKVSVSIPKPVSNPVVDSEELKKWVDAWLLEHVPNSLSLTGRIEGTVTL